MWMYVVYIKVWTYNAYVAYKKGRNRLGTMDNVPSLYFDVRSRIGRANFGKRADISIVFT